MRRRLTDLALIVSILFITAGTVFASVQSIFYEFKNGPPIITKDLNRSLMKVAEGRIAYPKVDSYIFWLSFDNLSKELTFVTKIAEDVYVASKIIKLDNKLYKIDSSTMSFEGSNPEEYKGSVSRVGLSKRILSYKFLNTRIDNIHFPNENTRKAEKRKISKVLEQYSQHIKLTYHLTK